MNATRCNALSIVLLIFRVFLLTNDGLVDACSNVKVIILNADTAKDSHKWGISEYNTGDSLCWASTVGCGTTDKPIVSSKSECKFDDGNIQILMQYIPKGKNNFSHNKDGWTYLDGVTAGDCGRGSALLFCDMTYVVDVKAKTFGKYHGRRIANQNLRVHEIPIES